MQRRSNLFREIDWMIILLYLALCIIGWLSIYSAEISPDAESIFSRDQEYGKQAIWIASSLFIGTVIMLLSSKMFYNYSWLFYGGSLLLLILVLIFGKVVGGAKSWFSFGGFSIQPSEFAKFSTLLMLGVFIANPQTNLRNLKDQLIAFGIMALPVGLILLQPDAGSALVYVSLIFVLYREGITEWYLWAGFSAIFLFISTLLFSKAFVILSIIGIIAIVYYFSHKKKRIKRIGIYIATGLAAIMFSLMVDFIYDNIFDQHQRDRIDIILGTLEDTSGVGYNLNQSKITIGSGGLLGKGFLNGTQTKFDFVPKQSTDFIFCTIGEEWGAVGSLVIISLFLMLIIRIIIVAEKQRSTFTRVYGYGVASILFIHVFINVGMTIGLVPVIGIPLPFLSYGGSSLWGFSILLFIYVKLASERKELL
jgi:rod shape determining protein RodA